MWKQSSYWWRCDPYILSTNIPCGWNSITSLVNILTFTIYRSITLSHPICIPSSIDSPTIHIHISFITIIDSTACSIHSCDASLSHCHASLYYIHNHPFLRKPCLTSWRDRNMVWHCWSGSNPFVIPCHPVQSFHSSPRSCDIPWHLIPTKHPTWVSRPEL